MQRGIQAVSRAVLVACEAEVWAVAPQVATRLPAKTAEHNALVAKTVAIFDDLLRLSVEAGEAPHSQHLP